MRLLIVNPRAFVSGWGGDTPRLLQMARGLSNRGWTLDPLRCRHPDDYQFRPVIDAFPGRVTTAPFFGPFSSLANHRGVRRALRLCWRLRGQTERDDYPELVASRLVRFSTRFGVLKPDLVFGYTCGQLESFVAAHRLSTHFGCPLVLEFRDPLPHPGNPSLDSRQFELLERCLAHASLVITTTKGISSLVAQKHPSTTGKVSTIYSCYDDETPTVAAENPPTDRLVLVHAGVLYGGPRRNARSLVSAIAEAARIEPSLDHRISLRLIGAGTGGLEAMELARQLKVPWGVELVPQLSHQKCLDEFDRAHVLVVIKFDDPEYDRQIPGKVFQYLGRRKPLLGIMRDTEAAQVLRRSGLGLVFEHSNIAGTAAALIDLWKSRGAIHSKFTPNSDYIRQFGLSAMAENFDRELSAHVAGGVKSAANPLGHENAPSRSRSVLSKA